MKLKIPFGYGEIEVEPGEQQAMAAWELYVELQTRIAVQPLLDGQGLLREVLTSLHSLFRTTREILRKYGPVVGKDGRASVGGVAIHVLNGGLRGFLGKWHPELSAWEAERVPGVSPVNHEAQWKWAEVFREELHELRSELEIYSVALADLAGIDHE